MFDRLLEYLVELWEHLNPLFVIYEYESGILLRGGKYSRELVTGIGFKIPVLDVVLKDWRTIRTSNLAPQSLTTKDGVCIVISVVIVYLVKDMKRFLLAVDGAEQAIEDCTYGVVSTVVLNTQWNELGHIALLDDMKKEISKRATKFGIRVTDVLLSDLTKARSLRLWHSTLKGVE